MGEDRQPPHQWLAELERIKAAQQAGDSSRPKVTILDLADRAADPTHGGKLPLPTSPRSIEACLHLGIDPATLAYKSLEYFGRKERDATLAQVEFEHHVTQRKERLRQLIAERRRLEEETGRSAKSGSKSGMAAKPSSGATTSGEGRAALLVTTGPPCHLPCWPATLAHVCCCCCCCYLARCVLCGGSGCC